MKKYTAIIFLAGIVIFNSCQSENDDNRPLSEEELGYRKTDIYDEDDPLGKAPKYSNNIPGTSENIDRAFENAPPLIPHTVEGQLPITIKKNLCIQCHMPEIADSLKSTSIPKSHFINYRPKHYFENNFFKRVDTISKTSEKNLKDKMYLGRYNCTQCHVPQAKVSVDIKNTFKAVFRNNKDSTNSNLDKNMNEGVK